MFKSTCTNSHTNIITNWESDKKFEMNSTEYKKYHESFMEHNHGSSAVHTFFCIFFTVMCSVTVGVKPKSSNLVQYVYEYIFIVLPMIAIHTYLAEYIYYVNLMAFLVLLYELKNKTIHFFNIMNKPNIYKTKTIQSISCMRGLTYLITVFAILAVDFREFPRYLAKTENYGYSLMDTGVGLFALMSGLVHKNLKNEKLVTVMKSNAKFITILILLGTVRFISVKKLDYHEHVTEYGVHWNFFYTLAVCKLLSTALLYNINRPLFLSIITIIIHEITLYNGLQNWVFSDSPRNDLISANREGLCSSLGYVSMYLFAVDIKNLLTNRNRFRSTVFTHLFIRVILLSCISFVVNIYSPASRTLANTAYCLFLETVLCIVLTLLYTLETLSNDNKFHFAIPTVLKDVNMNGLSYFLVSNLMTGAVNLTIRTLLVPSYVTFIILNVYMIGNISFCVFMKNKGFKI